jgi:hypothetical protein
MTRPIKANVAFTPIPMQVRVRVTGGVFFGLRCRLIALLLVVVTLLAGRECAEARIVDDHR